VGITFEPLKCSCGLTCSYLIRVGDEHKSVESRDRWQGVATAYCRTSSDGQPYIYIMGACGKMRRKDYFAVFDWLFEKGFTRIEYEHKGRERFVIREQWSDRSKG
jgi:hypothetical protein